MIGVRPSWMVVCEKISDLRQSLSAIYRDPPVPSKPCYTGEQITAGDSHRTHNLGYGDKMFQSAH